MLTVSKEYKEKGSDKRVHISVEEAENGFIICKTINYEKDGKYHHESKKFISKTNPLEIKKKEMEESDEEIAVWDMF